MQERYKQSFFFSCSGTHGNNPSVVFYPSFPSLWALLPFQPIFNLIIMISARSYCCCCCCCCCVCCRLLSLLLLFHPLPPPYYHNVVVIQHTHTAVFLSTNKYYPSELNPRFLSLSFPFFFIFFLRCQGSPILCFSLLTLRSNVFFLAERNHQGPHAKIITGPFLFFYFCGRQQRRPRPLFGLRRV